MGDGRQVARRKSMVKPAPIYPLPLAGHRFVNMGPWEFYFIAKLFLYFGGFMGFHFLANLAFAFCLMTPLPGARLERVRQLIAFPAGLVLFYYDTWFPSFVRLISQISAIEEFDVKYLFELVGRLFNPWVVAALCLLYGIYFIARRRLRIITFIGLAMLATLVPVATKSPMGGVSELFNRTSRAEGRSEDADYFSATPPKDSELTGVLNSFYEYESGRAVAFPTPSASDPPFDILVVQVCSLSWDDLDFVKERSNPLFDRFNIVFSNFNSAASYSGPAVIRLLRSSAGHQKHHDLYDPPTLSAQTFENLKKIGYDPQLAMNHDGRYGNLLVDIRERGGLKSTPFSNKTATPYLQSFDGTPVYDDFSVLSKWWEQRLKSSSERVALFYNTVSLHDGNRYAGGASGRSLETYHPRLRKLMSDLEKFFVQVEISGRRAVVVFIPEHGASIRGDKMQIAGMREIPSPRIGHVPVGVKLIGLQHSGDEKPLIAKDPSSYLAVSKLLAEFIGRNPFVVSRPDLEEYVRELPVSGFVSENADLVVMRYGRQYFMHSKDTAWVEYDPTP